MNGFAAPTLLLSPRNDAGSRTISLARFGAFDVRFIELIHSGMTDFWIELYCHYPRSSLDSSICREPNDAEHLAVHLISCARELIILALNRVAIFSNALPSL